MSPDERTLKLLKMEERRRKSLASLGMTVRSYHAQGQAAPPRPPPASAPPKGARGRRTLGDGAPLRRLGLTGKPWRNLQPPHCLPHSQWEPPESMRGGVSRDAEGQWRLDDPKLRAACGGTEPERAAAVVDAARGAWAAYRAHAWGHDELHPISQSYSDWAGGGIGLTLVDSMDTLWLMGLAEEFEEAAWWVEEELDLGAKDDHVSVFELSIRIIGGLLAAYTLSVDDALLRKARDVADRLLPAFGTPSGIPKSLWNPRARTGKFYGWSKDHALLAEAGTLQMEWRYLSWLTRNETYDRVVTKVMDIFAAVPRPRGYRDGLWPLFLDVDSGNFASNLYGVGGMGDSHYEYLLKQWLQAGNGLHAAAAVAQSPLAGDGAGGRGTYTRYAGMWNSSLTGIRRWIVGRSGGRFHLSQRAGKTLRRRMDHLSCFFPGLLALSVLSQGDEPLGAEEAARLGWGTGPVTKLQLAESLMATCIEMYDTPTGLPPEDVLVLDDRIVAASRFYILRPEAFESLFYLWRVTRKQQYRDAGWRFFRAIQRFCRTPRGAFHGVEDVHEIPPAAKDQMESFFIAETLKYFYLLFSDDSVLPLERFVLNTEAHPLPVVPAPPPSSSIYQDITEEQADAED